MMFGNAQICYFYIKIKIWIMSDISILYIDDEQLNLNILSEYIACSSELWNVITCSKPFEAKQMIQSYRPDLIITDWDMPGLNGIELVKQLKQDESLAEIPVIMCTGIMLNSYNIDVALQAGAVDFIKKPFDYIELKARIRSMLKLSASYKVIKSLSDNRDKIFSIIAHDFKGPINSITNICTQIIENTDEHNCAALLHILSLIRNQSAQIYYGLENLLYYTNQNRINSLFNPSNVNINNVITDEILFNNFAVLNKQITIVFEPTATQLAYCDKNQIAVVIRNLISNALKFSNNGSKVLINLSESKTEETITITVKDFGTGIDSVTISDIMKQNFIKSAYGTAGEKGSGIGLHICSEFIKLNNGRLNIQSQPNFGTEISFTLPIVK